MDDEPFIIDARDGPALNAALGPWWLALIARARRALPPWDVVVLDVWIDTGRVIGWVQRDSDPVGTDAGFRVAAHVPWLVDRLDADGGSVDAWLALEREMLRRCTMAARKSAVHPALVQLHADHPFRVRWYCAGEWEEDLALP